MHGPADGKKLRSGGDALDLMGEAMQSDSRLVVLAAERLDDDFFRLRTGVAGEFIQKFVTYRVRLAIVGDISRHVAASPAFRDFVAESNRGEQLWFVANREELEERLRRAAS